MSTDTVVDELPVPTAAHCLREAAMHARLAAERVENGDHVAALDLATAGRGWSDLAIGDLRILAEVPYVRR